jgi:hypothetical protein
MADVDVAGVKESVVDGVGLLGAGVVFGVGAGVGDGVGDGVGTGVGTGVVGADFGVGIFGVGGVTGTKQ